jgi:hypothetical protein
MYCPDHISTKLGEHHWKQKKYREGLPPFDRHGLILVPQHEKVGKVTEKISKQALEEDLARLNAFDVSRKQANTRSCHACTRK